MKWQLIKRHIMIVLTLTKDKEYKQCQQNQYENKTHHWFHGILMLKAKVQSKFIFKGSPRT